MNKKIIIAFYVIAVFMAAVVVIGNALVCHVIVRLKTMKTSINYIILNLAILDVIAGFAGLFYVFTADTGTKVFGEPIMQQAYNQSSRLADVLCRIELCYWLPVSITPLLLTIMSYERFKAIVHPLSRLDGTATKARLKWMLPFAWILGAASILGLMPIVRYDDKTGTCHYPTAATKVHAIVLDVSWLVISYITPSTAMLIFYCRIICALRRQDNALGPQAEAERARRKARKKVMQIVVAVTLVFYVCCGFPTVVYVVVVYLNVNLEITWNTFVFFLLFGYAFNSAFNPLVYFTFIQSFRDGFRKIFSTTRREAPIRELEMNCTSQCSLGNANIAEERRE